jgi:hypothetical protein
MQVVRQTEDVIELEHTPVPWVIGLGSVCVVLSIGLLKALFEGEFVGAFIALAMLAGLSWLMITRIIRRLRVVADRGAGTLRISATTVRGEGSASYPLAELLRAEVQTRHDSGTSTAETAMVLVMADGHSPRHLRLDPFHPDSADLLYASDRLNAWLGSGRQDAPENSTRPEHKPT